MSKLELIATTSFGLESIVAIELKNLGYDQIKKENGKVSFIANELGICRTNLWLRSAERVTIKIGSFKAFSFEELFQNTKGLPWEEWLPVDAQFPVLGKSVRSQLYSVSDCQAIIKKAIVERMKDTYGISWFEETGSKYTIEASLVDNIVTLTLDTSGQGLHKRGYRRLAGQAPLKETLAAAMIQLSHWNSDWALIDPFCGTGTIPIEAAMIAQNRAPGLKRSFVSENWPNILEKSWKEAREEALDLWKKEIRVNIFGSDIDSEALRLARIHAQEADLENTVFFQRLPVAEVRSRFQYGHLITNPPYGKRIGGDLESIDDLYIQLGETFKRLETWSLHFLTSYSHPEHLIGRRWDKSRKLYNGKLECHYYQFLGPRPKKEKENDIIKN